MYQVKITEMAIIEGEQTIARINILANQALELKVLSGGETNWRQLTEAITKAIEFLESNERGKNGKF